MLLCTIVENGANTRFCRESGECRDYALFLSFFYSEIYSEKSNFGRILAEILPKKLAAGGSGLRYENKNLTQHYTPYKHSGRAFEPKVT